MSNKLDYLRGLAEQLPVSNTDILEWEWHSFMHFQSRLVAAGILKRRPPTNNHLRELTRLAVGHPPKAPRTVAARWAKRVASQLSQEPHAA